MTGWHVIKDEGSVTVSRLSAPRWDIAVRAVLPAVTSRTRLAHQVRQDMWRALQRLRGFAPAVKVTRVAESREVLAGGDVSGSFPRAQTEATIVDLLDCPRHRARWVQNAGRRVHA